MYTVEHIGIAVKSLAESDPLFRRLLNVDPYKHEAVAEQGVITSFFDAGHAKIELLEATHAGSPIAKFIDKKGEGIHHIAFEVDDIRAEMRRLKEEGFHLLQEQPSVGADNKWVCFVHPRTANGVLVEICQTIPVDESMEGDAVDD